MSINDLNKCSCELCKASANNNLFVNGAGWICGKCGKTNVFNESVSPTAQAENTEVACTDCDWSGTEKQQMFINGWHVCPLCKQPDFLVSGDELDEMNELEGATF